MFYLFFVFFVAHNTFILLAQAFRSNSAKSHSIPIFFFLLFFIIIIFYAVVDVVVIIIGAAGGILYPQNKQLKKNEKKRIVLASRYLQVATRRRVYTHIYFQINNVRAQCYGSSCSLFWRFVCFIYFEKCFGFICVTHKWCFIFIIYFDISLFVTLSLSLSLYLEDFTSFDFQFDRNYRSASKGDEMRGKSMRNTRIQLTLSRKVKRSEWNVERAHPIIYCNHLWCDYTCYKI